MYVESMGRTLLNLFKSYYAQLLKQDLVIATKGDLIAVEEATLKNMFTQKVRRAFPSRSAVT
jgi:Ni2+-binding GTPase involved in maturation of urease and hydrogenase